MTSDDLTVLQRQRIAAALRQDPSAIPVKCEAPGCATVKPLGQMFSLLIWYPMPGPGKAPYMCAHEQHYGCSHEHARAAVLACLDSHIEGGDHA